MLVDAWLYHLVNIFISLMVYKIRRKGYSLRWTGPTRIIGPNGAIVVARVLSTGAPYLMNRVTIWPLGPNSMFSREWPERFGEHWTGPRRVLDHTLHVVTLMAIFDTLRLLSRVCLTGPKSMPTLDLLMVRRMQILSRVVIAIWMVMVINIIPSRSF